MATNKCSQKKIKAWKTIFEAADGTKKIQNTLGKKKYFDEVIDIF